MRYPPRLMHVLLVAAELAPWIKVGGLADVVGSLPKALRAQEVDARVCVPAFASVLERAPDPRSIARFDVPHHGGPIPAEVFESVLDGVPVYLIAGGPIPPDSIAYTGRPDEDGRRFAFFSLAALELARRLRPDVLHAHDWHAAVATYELARRRPDDPALSGISSVLTIHNLPYAGGGTERELAAFGVPPSDDPRLPAYHRLLPLALGLSSADRLTTVSAGYRDEILGPEHGSGFDRLLRSRADDLSGILNGLDEARWDPSTDRELAACFDASDRTGRAGCRAALHEELGFEDDGAPLVGLVSRLAPQKGVDVALDALRRLEQPFRAVLLGSGDPHLEHALRVFAAERPTTVLSYVGFDDGLARRIYAGADMMMVPSRYEPCGMTQLIAMRYGCVPVACETGGLADTVRDLDLSDVPTGVLFPDASPSAAVFALRRAFATFSRKEEWARLVRNGMATDFTWARSARAYMDIYEELARARAPGERHR